MHIQQTNGPTTLTDLPFVALKRKKSTPQLCLHNATAAISESGSDWICLQQWVSAKPKTSFCVMIYGISSLQLYTDAILAYNVNVVLCCRIEILLLP